MSFKTNNENKISINYFENLRRMLQGQETQKGQPEERHWSYEKNFFENLHINGINSIIVPLNPVYT